MKYAIRIRELREDSNLAQREVADLLNIGQKTYSDYELEKTRIPLESIIILAKYYDVSIDYICGVTEDKGKFPQK